MFELLARSLQGFFRLSSLRAAYKVFGIKFDNFRLMPALELLGSKEILVQLIDFVEGIHFSIRLMTFNSLRSIIQGAG